MASGPSRTPRELIRRLGLLILASSLPALIACLAVTWTSSYSLRFKITVSVPLVLLWTIFVSAAALLLIRQLQTLTNVLASLREGDYSLRARVGGDDALAELSREANLLADTLQRQRRNETEATHLLTTVLAEVDAAIFAFDPSGCLRLANPQGSLLLSDATGSSIGRSAAELGLQTLLEGEPVRVVSLPFREGPERWGLRRSTFYSEGRPHTLLLLADLSMALREEEQIAWQRLVRVLTHELNNSLTPIKSIAGSLLQGVQRGGVNEPQDLARGLEIIATRAENLQRFTAAYAELARLPEPVRRPVQLSSLFSRIQFSNTNILPRFSVPDDLPEVRIDAALIEQALINLVKNAIEAAASAAAPEGPRVEVQARTAPGAVQITIEDNGEGIANSANLFVPFFSTKPGGSGIGLVLARQIVEKHGGRLTLENIPHRGCRAIVTLPV